MCCQDKFFEFSQIRAFLGAINYASAFFIMRLLNPFKEKRNPGSGRTITISYRILKEQRKQWK